MRNSPLSCGLLQAPSVPQQRWHSCPQGGLKDWFIIIKTFMYIIKHAAEFWTRHLSTAILLYAPYYKELAQEDVTTAVSVHLWSISEHSI